MIDSALNIKPVDSFYFQLYPINLHLKTEPIPKPTNTFKFAIMKGQNKTDENKVPISANFKKNGKISTMVLPKCSVNFYIPALVKGKKSQFQLKLNMTEQGQQYQMASYNIDPEIYAVKFKEQKFTRFEEKIQLSDQFTLEFELYVEKSRLNLQKVVKQFKNERSVKSPTHERKEFQSGSTINKQSPIGKYKSNENKSETYQEIDYSYQKEQKTGMGKHNRVEPREEFKKEVVPTYKQEKPADTNSNTGKSGKSNSSKQISSPMLNTKRLAKAKGQRKMSISGRYNPNQDLMKEIVQVKKKGGNQKLQYNFKLIAFVFFSLIIIYLAMTPSRRYRNNRK